MRNNPPFTEVKTAGRGVFKVSVALAARLQIESWAQMPKMPKGSETMGIFLRILWVRVLSEHGFLRGEGRSRTIPFCSIPWVDSWCRPPLGHKEKRASEHSFSQISGYVEQFNCQLELLSWVVQ